MKRHHAPDREGCAYCMVTLDPREGAEFVACAGPVCGRRYHRACWARGAACVDAACGSTHSDPVELPEPTPLVVAVECRYPTTGAPNNTLRDRPLGISCAVVFDSHEQVLVVRNNSAERVQLPLHLGPLWAPLLPDSMDWYNPATGTLDPGETVRFRAVFSRVRPPFARRRVPVGADQEVEMRTSAQPLWHALAVGGVCLLLVVHAALVVRAAGFGGSPWWAAAALGASAGLTAYLSPGGLLGWVAGASSGVRRALAGVYENVTRPETRVQWCPLLAALIGVLVFLLSRLPLGLIVYALGWLAGIESGVLRFCATSVAFLVYTALVFALWSPWVNEYGVDLVPLIGKTVRRSAAAARALRPRPGPPATSGKEATVQPTQS